jgi:hypothetical protein
MPLWLAGGWLAGEGDDWVIGWLGELQKLTTAKSVIA